MFQGQSTARTHLGLIAFRQGDVQSCRYLAWSAFHHRYIGDDGPGLGARGVVVAPEENELGTAFGCGIRHARCYVCRSAAQVEDVRIAVVARVLRLENRLRSPFDRKFPQNGRHALQVSLDSRRVIPFLTSCATALSGGGVLPRRSIRFV